MMTAYKNLAKYYDLIYDLKDMTTKEISFLEWAFENLTKVKVEKILDAAAGTGRQVIALLDRGYQVTASDASQEMLEVLEKKSKKRGYHIPIFCRDVREIDFREEFDAAIFIFTSFNHLISNRDIELSLSALYQALRPSGLLVFDVANFLNLLGRFKFGLVEHFHKDGVNIIRSTSPRVDDVEDVFLHDELTFVDDNGVFTSFAEKIPLRIFTTYEVVSFLKETGFREIRHFRGWDDRGEKKGNTFRLIFVALR